MNTKSYYGNINYGLIDSNKAELAGLDIPMPQTAAKLGFPPSAGYFFETMRDEALDTLDKIIVITKKGHLKFTFKANIFTNGGDIDIQIMKLDTSGVVARRRFSTDGYTEANFDVEVEANDRFVIYLHANIGDALLEYIPAEGSLIEQSAYVINMELTEPFDEIGSLKWSVDPNLESYGNCLRLDLARPLLKTDYPLLYAKLIRTPYVIDDAGDYFTIIDFKQYPYLRASTTLALMAENLPNPVVTSAFSNGVASATGEGKAFFGGNNYNHAINSGDLSGCFLPDSRIHNSTDWGGEWAAGSVGLRLTHVTLKVNSHSHTTSGKISNTTTNTNYSSEQEVRPNSSQMFLYMICDNQL